MSTEFEEKTTKHTQIYRSLGQGLKILHDHQYADVDILAIPGLGTNPEECWTWVPSSDEESAHKNLEEALSSPHLANGSKQSFNWLRDSDGLASLFPKSRIMLYDYASAWQGRRKVRATMKSICTWLLDDLKEKRKGGDETTRPLIIIAHSMGGIVAAKALCIAKAKREFESIVTYTVGCAFFGCPFRGSDMAKIALLYSSVFGNEAYESLLSFMRSEKNDTLDEVTNDFMEICGRLVPPIDLFCAWEQNPTAVSYSEKISQKVPGLLQQQFFKAGARKFMEAGFSAFGTGTHFVEKESAELQGAHSVGLTAGHSDLIKFEGVSSAKFVPVKVALFKMVQTAKTSARKRALMSGERLLPQKFVNQVRQSLEGVDMSSKFRTKAGMRPVTSWVESEPLYQRWLTPAGQADSRNSHLWLKGGAGLGKTNASLAAIQRLGRIHSNQSSAENDNSQSETFLAYFLCDWSSGCCTAEDVLKSLIIQLINQDESLAQHARWFVPNPRYRGPAHLDTRRTDEINSASGAKATATVDNLWKCLQDMIDDPVASSVHIVINNLHCLDSGPSTTAILDKLRLSAFEAPQTARAVKWLVTSRSDKQVNAYLTAECISTIDMENDAVYGSKVKNARAKHARDAMMQLRTAKEYSPDLAYYVRNFVESQSEDEKWIDVLCILLKAKPSESSSLSVRKWLREAGTYNTPRLVDHAWNAILCQDADAALEIEELMHATTIAYEPPSLADLAVLTQIDDVQRLTNLVRRCSPVLRMSQVGDRVTFTSLEFKERLHTLFFGGSDAASPNERRYHGLMALRCFKHIKTSRMAADWQTLTPEVVIDKASQDPPPLSPVTATLAHDVDILIVTHEDDMPGDADVVTSAAPTPLTSQYPTRYLFRHLSEAFPDAVQELCEDDPGFWAGESALRESWLRDLQMSTTDLKDLTTHGMSVVHVAAGIGADNLVALLVNRNKALSSSKSADGMTALHVAAFNNHPKTVDTLLRAGADIEAGEGEAGTPLHLAALRGNHSIMRLLIDKGASVNAASNTIGPVINAAIRSGVVDAVKLVMDGDVHFEFDYTKCDPPLSLSAGISEPSLFRDILQSGRAKWLDNAKLIDQALVAASYSGRLESVRILLNFAHAYTNNTLENAVLSAALEKNWPSVNELLDYIIKETTQGNRRDVKLDHVFHLAAISREEHLVTLEKIWKFKNCAISKEICDYSLYQAAVLNKNATVDWLLTVCDADPNTTADRPSSTIAYSADVPSFADFWNPLNAAASSGNTEMVRSLIRKGAEVESDRVYALQLAASEGHNQVVDILLKHGALANKQVPDSEELGFFSGTALQAACDNKRIQVVRSLVDHGADPNLGGGVFTNPITAATQKAQPEILELLVRAPGIDVNVVGNEDHATPLINAAANMSMEAVELLLEHGADINAKNAVGDTALIMAAWRGDGHCVKLLCNQGADVTYRSPVHGLPIVAAASALHPSCATILADKMGKDIEVYREQVKIDPSRNRLKEAVSKLQERDSIIEELSSTLAEVQDQLESAYKDIELHKHEKKRLLDARDFQGETWESVTQQIRAMQSERVELLKQLDASKGQTGLANESIDKVQALLNHERQANAALRKRQELKSLQEEIQVAHEAIEAERQKGVDLKNDKCLLQDKIVEMEKDLESVLANLEVAVQASHFEKLKQEAMKDESKVWEAKYREEVLASVRAAEDRAAMRPLGPPPPPPRRPVLPRPENDDTNDILSMSPPPLDTRGSNSPGPRDKPFENSHSQTTAPADGRFSSVHGYHRPDGSLGGYRGGRARRGLLRVKSDSLYESSIREEPSTRYAQGAQGPRDGSGSG